MKSTCLLVTTFNRTPLLQHSLNRLVELTIPDEVLVVDDGGSDGCAEMCAQMADRLPMRYLYHHHPEEALCSEARNVGIRNTDCDLVITSEPEIIFETDVVAQMLDGHERTGKIVSAGTVHHAHEHGEGETLVGWVAPFAALYVRSWLLDVGGWDEAMPDPWSWEDTDLLTRLRVNGHGQFIDPAIHVRHQWHPTRHCNQDANEAHFRAKDLQNSTAHIVANQGRPWGTIRTS